MSQILKKHFVIIKDTTYNADIDKRVRGYCLNMRIREDNGEEEEEEE